MKIDLGTELGNAFELMAITYAAALQMCMTEQQARDIVRRMTKGGYIDLLNVMDDVFPHCFQFENDPRQPTSRKRSVKRLAPA